MLALTAQAIKPPTPAAASQDAPPPTPPAPNPLPRRTVPWKQKKDPAILVGMLPQLAPCPLVVAASPPVAALPSCPTRIGQAPKPPHSPREVALQVQLDQAMLDLSIMLLDHPLKGDLFKSTLVGFLAVLGVDPAC